MKKKWIIICSISILISAAIFADTEFDVYYYGVPVTDTYTAVNKDKFAHKSALGIGNDLGFYFVNFPHADIGIACNYGAEFFRTAEVPFISKIISSQFAVFDWAVCAFVNAAPVVRFTVNRYHSFIVSQGIQFRLLFAEKSENEEMGMLAWQMDAFLHGGYRLWVLNKTNFRLGLSTGAYIFVPVGVAYAAGITHGGIKASLDEMTGGGFGTRLYAGVCVNFNGRNRN